MSDTQDVLLKSPLPAPGSTYKWELHGIDIHDEYLKPALKRRVHPDLRLHDVNCEFPAEWNWQNSFDIVHQRLLIWGIKKQDWPKAVERLLGLVKPGGWLELVEVVWVDNDVEITHPELAKQKIFQTWTCDQHGFDIDVGHKLERMLQQAGCQKVAKYEYELGIGAKAKRDYWKGKSMQMWNETYRSFEYKVPRDGISGVAKTPQELHDFLDRLNVEIEEHGYAPKINFVIGQKPA
ncbi:hypothetical protein CDD83_9433 [Cordyceps sp. RAO-2017]|nr:hypothetical protein CDD83_9433 [Cordyceps sp. RAO-2017]